MSKDALQAIPVWTQGVPDAVEIYTDGSLPKDELLASWGLVILVVKDKVRFLFGGLCATLANSGTVCSIAKPSSTTSELAGLTWGLLWNLAAFPNVPTKFFSDSTSAIGLTTGHFASAAGSDLATLAAMMFRLKAVRASTQCQHVKAHRGDPWNELADWLAACPQFHTYRVAASN